MQGGTPSSEFRIPDSELEGSLEFRVPCPQPLRLIPVPSDKILLPRRMLYVEAVLYATVALASFGLGYLAGHRGSSSGSQADLDVQKRVPVEGKVMLSVGKGDKPQADEGAVIIALPADRLPDKPLPIAGLRPDDPRPVAGKAISGPLADFGGAAARTDASGEFTLFVPQAGNYQVLVISRQATADRPSGFASIGKYFEQPVELIERRRYKWWTTELKLGIPPIDVELSE